MSSLRSEQVPSDRVFIIVKNQNGEEAYYKMKRTANLGKLMNTHCSKFSLESNTVTFLFDGNRIREEYTPNQVRMEDVEQIDCMTHQTGGYGVYFA